MFKTTDEIKVLRDPVHGYIHVSYEVVWQCINSDWFQRLRRIKQLGGASMVYHGAEHTRFSHSLGVYEIVRRMVNEVSDLQACLSEEEKLVGMLAGLLHDIGHGPYSHAFERVMHGNHEQYSCLIIEGGTSITRILEECMEGLSTKVADVIRHTSDTPLLEQLISGQLDADRMDYLLRDAYYTGTTYGEFDLERILRVLRVENQRLVVKESGIYAIENYIMARYHMYWQIYYHPVARSFEWMLDLLFKRLKELKTNGLEMDCVSFFEDVLEEKMMDLDAYYALDEARCMVGFMRCKQSGDAILSDLADRLLSRRLFDYQEANVANVEKVLTALEACGYNREYYHVVDQVEQLPYSPYTDKSTLIYVRMHGGDILELSKVSSIVAAVSKGRKHSDVRVFYPKEIGEFV